MFREEKYPKLMSIETLAKSVSGRNRLFADLSKAPDFDSKAPGEKQPPKNLNARSSMSKLCAPANFLPPPLRGLSGR